MPVSWGRGETSLNHTSSPLMKSSTPNRPWPPRASTTLAATSGAGQGQLAHGLGLPGLAVVTLFLAMAYGIAEVDAVHGAHSEQRYLVLEGDEAFDDHLATAARPSWA